MTGAPVLTVDDNAINLKLVQAVVQLDGYEVRAAAGEALAVPSSSWP
jgi:CheY-like chemotaxis protein